LEVLEGVRRGKVELRWAKRDWAGLGGAFKCYSVFAKKVSVFFAENVFVFSRRC
jgi:hypothetical protein